MPLFLNTETLYPDFSQPDVSDQQAYLYHSISHLNSRIILPASLCSVSRKTLTLKHSHTLTSLRMQSGQCGVSIENWYTYALRKYTELVSLYDALAPHLPLSDFHIAFVAFSYDLSPIPSPKRKGELCSLPWGIISPSLAGKGPGVRSKTSIIKATKTSRRLLK